MDQNVKSRWIEALRSGRYSMTDDGLKTSKGFTALGVLADIYCHDIGGQWFPVVVRSEETLYGIYKGTENEKKVLVCDGRFLTRSMKNWAGLPTSAMFLKGYPLTMWENSKVNFPKLADLIEKETTL